MSAVCPKPEFFLVLTNCPDDACAERIAKTLVERGLAACVNILAPCRSIYRWQGAIEEAAEIPLLIKTRINRYSELEDTIKACHPYTVPEIIALPIRNGLPAYLDWLSTETGSTKACPP
ncbi:MAG: Divalent-cation tolerance protein CutA [Betaproteobacteria bacterium ADurb.Bin341]|nr:MAG: Divalent-cation tolerance protein CutA [Betaproteobacteria bacterium ADurb.Bin341]